MKKEVELEKRAYTQVSFIIQNMSKDLKNRIPKQLINMIENNKDTEYKIEDISEIELLIDTKKILSVIYTDYLATEEERKVIKNNEKKIYLQKERDKEKNYNVNIFNQKEMPKSNLENKEIIEIKTKWYERVLKKIKKLLKG